MPLFHRFRHPIGVAMLVFCLAGAMEGAPAMPPGKPADQGLWVATQSEKLDSGYRDSRSRLTMLIVEADGREIRREIDLRTLEVPGDGEKTLMSFKTPLDVAGSAFLSHSHANGSDEQWLFLPSVKRVKRISGSNRDGLFFGSEFAFEDLSSMEVARYRYEYQGADALGHKVRLFPTDAGSGYRHIDAWYHGESFRVEKMELHGKKEGERKSMTMRGYRQHAGRFWRPDTIEIVNLKSRRKSLFLFSDHRIGVKLDPSSFLPARLENAR